MQDLAPLEAVHRLAPRYQIERQQVRILAAIVAAGAAGAEISTVGEIGGVQVCQLRRALERNAAPFSIKTLRGGKGTPGRYVLAGEPDFWREAWAAPARPPYELRLNKQEEVVASLLFRAPAAVWVPVEQIHQALLERGSMANWRIVRVLVSSLRAALDRPPLCLGIKIERKPGLGQFAWRVTAETRDRIPADFAPGLAR